MTDSDRDLIRALLGEMQALRESNVDVHQVAAGLSARLDALPERFAEHVVRLDERLDEHSSDIGKAVERIATIERGVAFTKAWAAGAGGAVTLCLGWIAFALWRIPPDAWAAIARLGGHQ